MEQSHDEGYCCSSPRRSREPGAGGPGGPGPGRAEAGGEKAAEAEGERRAADVFIESMLQRGRCTRKDTTVKPPDFVRKLTFNCAAFKLC